MAKDAIIIRPIVVTPPGDVEQLQKVEREISDRVRTFGIASQQFAPVVAVLTIINDTKAWQWHVDDDGEVLHKSFKAYVESFEWTKSVPRLYQLMKEYRQSQIDAYSDDPDNVQKIEGLDYDYTARTRSTGTSFERFVGTQSKALGRAISNFETAAHNIFESDPNRDAALGMVKALRAATVGITDDLDSYLEMFMAAKVDAKEAKKAQRAQDKADAKAASDAAKLAGDDDDDDDDSDDDDDDDDLA
jgi:hypothetical protein